MIETFAYRGRDYPEFQRSGNAARFVLAFASEVCKGAGLDVGFGRAEWTFPGAIGVDLAGDHDAMRLPPRPGGWDFVFSSHTLEHLPDWVGALDHWRDAVRPGGVIFLYLPHPDQEYWRPWNDRRHLHSLAPETIGAYFRAERDDDADLGPGYRHAFVSAGPDLNGSFAAMAEVAR